MYARIISNGWTSVVPSASERCSGSSLSMPSAWANSCVAGNPTRSSSLIATVLTEAVIAARMRMSPRYTSRSKLVGFHLS